MTNIFHGDWVLYTPTSFPEAAPASAMFAKRANDDQDWYDYVNPGSRFGPGSVAFTAYWAAGQNSLIVGSAVRNPVFLFPAEQSVYEIPAYGGDEKQLNGKLYDPATETFSDPVLPPSEMQVLRDRIAALEAASASAKPPQEAKPAKQGGA
jgi:hypothetical protein